MPTPHHGPPRYGQPRYRLIADELRERIESGSIPPGALLPTESALTAEFRASRGTIRQAIAVLRDDRLVATEHGRGTYANPGRRIADMSKFSEMDIREREVSADQELADLFGVEVNTVLIEQQTVTREDGAVGTVVRTYTLPRVRH
ncbi:DNA-binding GntR family transcriptional regulator [Micromonospora sp. HB375]|uniref:GntR family transcriptional regulator n=1 Tax=Micromonospora TaxID=1873 RepID=UPI001AE4FA96|nr:MULTISPECIES: GntR family transcriptional regulator [unclassified Micromonospora]MBP1785744.1 DNA-binding GntR family transcriptional regulator [Micromonospora sp. HB375]MDH6470216.1 DNA-binding GntR family transcriptional regulator [Micromonospora sp. H404/HB375]